VSGGRVCIESKCPTPGIPYDRDGVYYDEPHLIPSERVRAFARWDQIPSILSLLNLKIGAIRGARQIVEHCSDVFMVVATWNRSAGELLLYRSQELARQIEDGYSRAVAEPWPRLLLSMAAGLRSQTSVQRLVPCSEPGAGCREPALLLNGQPSACSREAFLPVNGSLPCDSLQQYLWLEIKDRPPCNRREHTALFAIINRYLSPGDVPPSCLYARTLIAWFRGDAR